MIVYIFFMKLYNFHASKQNASSFGMLIGKSE